MSQIKKPQLYYVLSTKYKCNDKQWKNSDSKTRRNEKLVRYITEAAEDRKRAEAEAKCIGSE